MNDEQKNLTQVTRSATKYNMAYLQYAKAAALVSTLGDRRGVDDTTGFSPGFMVFMGMTSPRSTVTEYEL